MRDAPVVLAVLSASGTKKKWDLAAFQQEISARIDALPALPDVSQFLIRLPDDDHTSSKDLEAALEGESDLLGKVLRLANSSIYGRVQRVTQLADALKILGLRQACTLLLSAKLASYLDLDVCTYGLEQKGLWHHSLAVAATARGIGIHLQLPQQSITSIHTAALLHDLGKLVIQSCCLAWKRNLPIAKTPEDAPGLAALEQDELGANHAEVGARIAQRWKLSEPVTSIIADHHLPSRAKKFAREAAVVHVADYLVGTLGVGVKAEIPPESPLDGEALSLLACAPDFLSQLEAQAHFEVGTSILMLEFLQS